jgi:hypothetical protein
MRALLRSRPVLAVALSAAGLLAIVALGVRGYGGNVSALLHLDTPFAETHGIPHGVAVYDDAAYDGMLYYEVARELPALFAGRGEIRLDSPYRFQRILLPLFTYALALGNERAFPAAMLLINLASALGTLIVFLRILKQPSVHALTVVWNPAMLVGILYMLTEPLSLFFMALFFWRFQARHRRLDTVSMLMLLLSLLARETTVFLIGLLFLWFAWKRQWKDMLLALAPMLLLALWQWFLAHRLGAAGFQANSNIINIPLLGPIKTIVWAFTDSGLARFYRLASLCLLTFVLALAWILGEEGWAKKTHVDLHWLLLAGLTATVLCMHPHMWGALTSIGRVVTPFYPAYALYAADRDTRALRLLSWWLIGFSVIAAIGIASVPHPYHIS